MGSKWDTAPGWAQWFTVGDNGAAYWWSEKPALIAGRWCANAGETMRAESTGQGMCIEPRPQPSLFEPLGERDHDR